MKIRYKVKIQLINYYLKFKNSDTLKLLKHL